ncbi:372_t:CDS:1, partial [Gigaspora margarita]
YPLHNRHANVKDATTRRPIFSVGGELITLAKSAFILYEMIEWNYPALSPNTPSYTETNTPSTSGNKRRRQDGLEQSQNNSIPIILQPRISIKNLPSDSLVPIILPLHRLVLILKN